MIGLTERRVKCLKNGDYTFRSWTVVWHESLKHIEKHKVSGARAAQKGDVPGREGSDTMLRKWGWI